jgi:hypothetical protein
MVPHMPRARRRNQARQRLPRNARERKVDDIRIAKQIVEERFDGFEGIRPAKLKKNDPYFAPRAVDRHPD